MCRERIPVFLEIYSEQILATGKYLNVVRLCGTYRVTVVVTELRVVFLCKETACVATTPNV